MSSVAGGLWRVEPRQRFTSGEVLKGAEAGGGGRIRCSRFR